MAKQIKVIYFDSTDIAKDYRPMTYFEFLKNIKKTSKDNFNCDDLTKKITDYNPVRSIKPQFQEKRITQRQLTRGFSNNIQIQDVDKEELPKMPPWELMEYGLGIAGHLGDTFCMRSGYKLTKEDAIAKLINSALKVNADAIVLDNKLSCQNEKGYNLIGIFYIKNKF
ncbi:MAG: hypothetical protein Q7S33_01610 [Nanoarchaeota archaeon]|nr:hypothetical protein [Nanoarchaeota archaeon]